jgi:hypothetical protein
MTETEIRRRRRPKWNLTIGWCVMKRATLIFVSILALSSATARADIAADDADDLRGWCETVTKASSLVLCSDHRLRQQVIIRNKISMMRGRCYRRMLRNN